MKRRRKKSGRHSGNLSSEEILVEDYSENDFPYKEKMLEYMTNILEHHQMDEKMMEFVLSTMDINSRKDFINFTYNGSNPPADTRNVDDNEYYHIMENLYEPSHIGIHIISDLYSGKISIKEHDLKESIIANLRVQLDHYRKRNKQGFDDRIGELRDIFNLNDMEIEALLFLFCIYESTIEYWKSDYQNVKSIYDVLKLASSATKVPLINLKRILSKHGRLYLSGIIDRINVKRSDYFQLNDNIVEYLAGISDVSLMDKYIRPDREGCYEPSSFSIDQNAVDTLLSIITAPGRSNILFYGIAGTGKTELARSLVHAANKKAYFLQYGEADLTKRSYEESDEDRYLALAIAVNSIDPDKGVIIVDEADKILNSSAWYNIFNKGPASDKGSLNYFMDTSRAKIIWISNEIFRMEESSLRRFSFSLYFKEFSYRERMNIWENLLKSHSLRQYIPRKLVDELSYCYRVNAAGISSALDTLAMIYSDKKPDRKNIEMKLRDLLERHERLTRGGYQKENKPFNEITPHYNPNAINMDDDHGIALSAVTGFARRMIEEQGLKNANVNLLFWGAPGTGKTEFARYLAGQSGLRLIVKRGSDILSKWVGGTEENIAVAFREARESRAILFIDEADTLLYGRENAMRSWETSMTNEFLTQMENHSGILICCTNLLTSVDRAALRRFNFKFEFKPLAKEGKILLYAKYFNLKGKRLTPAMRQRVMDIPDLTPGDFRAVQLRLGHVKQEALSHEKIIRELEVESRYKNINAKQPVGF